jgi:hypothetical protein
MQKYMLVWFLNFSSAFVELSGAHPASQAARSQQQASRQQASHLPASRQPAGSQQAASSQAEAVQHPHLWFFILSMFFNLLVLTQPAS